jgi:ABC-2 type transport system ATP-binding protein
MSPIIRVNDLSKHFGQIRAVDNLSFSVEPGEIYGFLGQNGAGKSTTIRMLLTLVNPTQGTIELLGLDLRKHRAEILRQVGAVIERPDTYNYLSGFENLSLFAKMSGVKLTRKQLINKLASVGLEGREDGKVKTYSQGMKQRLAIAIAMVHDPHIIILDEPTNGLDPQGIAEIRNLIMNLGREQRKTVLISSHLLNEVELIADKILILDKGKKIAEGLVRDLLDPARMILELKAMNPELTNKVIRGSHWLANLKKQLDHQFIFELKRDEIPKLTAELVSQGVEILQIYPRYSLEDYFLSLTTTGLDVDHFAN